MKPTTIYPWPTCLCGLDPVWKNPYLLSILRLNGSCAAAQLHTIRNALRGGSITSSQHHARCGVHTGYTLMRSVNARPELARRSRFGVFAWGSPMHASEAFRNSLGRTNRRFGIRELFPSEQSLPRETKLHSQSAQEAQNARRGSPSQALPGLRNPFGPFQRRPGEVNEGVAYRLVRTD